MKKIKIIISFFLILISFILCGELFQKYLSTYTNQFSYFDISARDIQERKEAITLLEKLCKEHNVNLFLVLDKTENAMKCNKYVFCSTDTAELLKSKYNIYEGSFNSLFSGETNVFVYNCLNAAENENIQRCYFIGKYKNIQMIYELFNSQFGSSYIHKETVSSYHWLSYCIWAIVGVLIFLLTWLDIQFQKKENFILISLGKSVSSIVLKNIIADITFYIFTYLLIYLFLSRYTYLQYRIRITLPIFIFCLILSLLLYFTLYKIDYKEALYGANINESTVSNCYLLKVVTMIVAIAVLSCNILLISSNYEKVSQYKKIREFKDYSFLTLNKYSMTSYEKDDMQYAENVIKQIYSDYYKENKVAVSRNILNVMDEKCILINNNSYFLISDVIKKDNKENGIYIYFPSKCTDKAKKEQFILSTLETEFGDLNNFKLSADTYETNKKILHIQSSDSPGSIGFKLEKEPIIIYCNFSQQSLKTIDVSGSYAIYSFSDIMFNLSSIELEKLEEKYCMEEHGYYLTQQSVPDRFEQYRASLLRIIILNSVISALVILLEVFIISTLIKFEYLTHSMELAVKKILGYSIFERNRLLFILNTYSALIGIVTMTITSLMFKFSDWFVVIITGLILLSFEFIIIIYNIYKFEKTNISKILKGGSL